MSTAPMTQVEGAGGGNVAVTAASPATSSPRGSQEADGSKMSSTSRSQATGSKMSSQSGAMVASDKVRLDVLLITGQRRFFAFEPQTSVKEVRETIWNDWPQDWPPRPMSSTAVRVLHLGHILDDRSVLSAPDGPSSRGMPVGKTTVVHLLLRQAPTKVDGDDESLKKETSDPGCCSCTIC